MDFTSREHEESSGITQLFKLGICCCISLLVVMSLGLGLVYLIYGSAGFDHMTRPSAGNLGPIRIIQIFSSLFLLIPPLWLAWSENQKISQFYGFRPTRLSLLILVLSIMVVSMPLMEWSISVNQKMVLPGFMKSIQDWMKQAEDSAAELTKILLEINNISDFLITIFMIAVMPAIAEELMFRGGVQRSFTKIFNNPHVAIWLSAFIFSAIHFQFFGFLPRFLLGAAFGYLYYWSGSIWYSIAAHFINNAYAVCAAWYMQKNNIPLSEADQLHFNWYGYVISFVLTILLFQFFKKQTNQ